MCKVTICFGSLSLDLIWIFCNNVSKIVTCSEKNKANRVCYIVGAPSQHCFPLLSTKTLLSQKKIWNIVMKFVSPVKHWAYNPINIFGLFKSDVFCYH